MPRGALRKHCGTPSRRTENRTGLAGFPDFLGNRAGRRRQLKNLTDSAAFLRGTLLRWEVNGDT
jgi:hypothetical protein